MGDARAVVAVPLALKMRELKRDVTEQEAIQLEQKVSELEIAIDGFWGEPQTVDVKQFVAAWAKARKYYCLLTGKPLI